MQQSNIQSLKTPLTFCALPINLSGSSNVPSFFKTRHKGTFLFCGFLSTAFLCVRSCNSTERKVMYILNFTVQYLIRAIAGKKKQSKH